MKKEFIGLWIATPLFSSRLLDSFRFGRLAFGLTSSALVYMAVPYWPWPIWSCLFGLGLC